MYGDMKTAPQEGSDNMLTQRQANSAILVLARAAAAQLPAGAWMRDLEELESRLLDKGDKLDRFWLAFDLGERGQEFATMTADRRGSRWTIKASHWSGLGDAGNLLLRSQILVVAAHLAQGLEALLAEPCAIP